jgi:class 3 adenylate cyclase
VTEQGIDPGVSSLTNAEVAARAGTSEAEVESLIDLGLITPGPEGLLTEGDVRRTVIVRTLEQQGLPREAIATANRTGILGLEFLETNMYARFASLASETFAAASERTGVPLELLGLVRETTGAPPPKPTDRIREDELPVVEWLALQAANGFRTAATAGLLRAVGDSLRRIAESEAEWWRSEVIEPVLRSGRPVDDVAAPDFGEAMVAATDRAIISLYHALQMRSWTANIVSTAEVALHRAGLVDQRVRQPAIVFLDITGYTQLTQEQGDAAAAALAERLGRLVQRTSVAHGGRPVKFLGDGVMFVFPEAGPAVLSSLDMVRDVADAGLPPAHVGIASGPVIFQEGDYYGATVNLAARISDFARPGEVLVSEAVVTAAGLPDASFVEVGPVELKGVAGPVRLLAAVPHGSPSLG